MGTASLDRCLRKSPRLAEINHRGVLTFPDDAFGDVPVPLWQQLPRLIRSRQRLLVLPELRVGIRAHPVGDERSVLPLRGALRQRPYPLIHEIEALEEI